MDGEWIVSLYPYGTIRIITYILSLSVIVSVPMLLYTFGLVKSANALGVLLFFGIGFNVEWIADRVHYQLERLETYINRIEGVNSDEE